MGPTAGITQIRARQVLMFRLPPGRAANHPRWQVEIEGEAVLPNGYQAETGAR
jgi:hypothetical protein